MSEIGHNSGDTVTVTAIAKDQLRSFVERIENLLEERKTLSDDIKDVYAEAKGTGFDTKIIRKIVALRRRDQAELKEEQAILELYCEALGLDFLI